MNMVCIKPNQMGLVSKQLSASTQTFVLAQIGLGYGGRRHRRPEISDGERMGLPPHCGNTASKGLSDLSPARNWNLPKIIFLDYSIIIIIVIPIVYRHKST